MLDDPGQGVALYPLRLAVSLLSSGRLSILIYHRVLPRPDPMMPGEVHASLFARHMALLAEQFNVLPLSEAVERLRKNSLPRRAVAITFDDGYADNAEVALPILRDLGLTATFFIATAYLDGGGVMWNDLVMEALRAMPGPVLELSALGLGPLWLRTMDERRVAAKRVLVTLKYLDETVRCRHIEDLLHRAGIGALTDMMMGAAQVRQLSAAGMEIGGHTMHHPILARVDTNVARAEIAGGKMQLESITGSPLRLFAYPNGQPGIDYTRDHVRMVRNLGFSAAVSTAWGTASLRSDPYQLPRFTPWDRSESRFMLRMMQNYLRRREERVD